jgi:hypothetical protein
MDTIANAFCAAQFRAMNSCSSQLANEVLNHALMQGSFRVPPDLLTVRHKQGVSLHDIAALTKIGLNYLQAIEDGDFDKLPGGVYTTSYIRQYARAIDYDENELLQCYYRAAGIRQEPPEPPPARRSSALLMWFARVFG